MSDTTFCAICTGDVGPFVKRALGKDDAIVDICEGCDADHPRTGRYAFAGSETPPRGTMNPYSLLGSKKSGGRRP